MATRETEGDWGDQKVEDVSVPEDQRVTAVGLHAAPRDNGYRDCINTLHEMSVV